MRRPEHSELSYHSNYYFCARVAITIVTGLCSDSDELLSQYRTFRHVRAMVWEVVESVCVLPVRVINCV